jgi:hypothetical protein
VLIVCIMAGIATAALMSWLQPALERWAVRRPPRQAAATVSARPTLDR